MAKFTFSCIDAPYLRQSGARRRRAAARSLHGASMSERRQHFLAEFDWIRTGLMFEPRGHDMMSGSILYPPTRADCDVGILFIETSGCLPMCGHGTIGTVTVALENGLVRPKTPGALRLETPAGLVDRRATSRTASTSSRCASPTCPGFLHSTGLEVDCPGHRPAQGRRRLWRQFLRHRRAAGGLSRHGGLHRRQTASDEPDAAPER